MSFPLTIAINLGILVFVGLAGWACCKLAVRTSLHFGEKVGVVVFYSLVISSAVFLAVVVSSVQEHYGVSVFPGRP